MKKHLALLASVSASLAANAAGIDTATATAGVSDAQGAMIVVLAAMVTFVAIKWGYKRIISLFGR